MKMVCYTDGSAVVVGKNKGKGGFGVYFPNHFGKKKMFSKGFSETKTGAMEVTALLTAIKSMPKKYSEKIFLTVYSDSEYVVKTFTEQRLERWKSNGWRNGSGVVKNLTLWQEIDKELIKKKKFLSINLVHIKSHQVDRAKGAEAKALLLENEHILGNSIADKLADYKRFIK